MRTQQIPQTPGSAGITHIDETPKVVKKDDAPKRDAKPSTEVAFGRMKELEADSDLAKKNPEAQARLRQDSRQAYLKALQLDPNNLEAYRGLGRLYTKMGDCDRAQENYRKAMTKYPKDATLWYDLGLCYHRKREFPDSARCFSKALEIDPDNVEYLKKLGFTYAWMGQYDHGLALLTRSQGAALGHYNLARVLIQKDQKELARRHLNAALRENGQLQDARDLLASLDTPITSGLGRPFLND
jgi:tetratricopeptide (TPR) repeat protein